MALDKITVQYTSEIQDLQRNLDAAIGSMRQLDTETKKTGNTIDKQQRDLSNAAKSRADNIKKETENIKRLQRERAKAFDPDEIREYNRQIERSQENISLLRDNTKQATANTNRLGQAFTRVAGIISAAAIANKIKNIASEAVQMAAKAEGIETAFNNLNRPGLLNELRDATRGTVTDLELMRQAVRAENFQVPLEQLGTFFDFATKRAAQTGESVDFLVDSIINGIGRKSSLVLDNLGISASRLQTEFAQMGDFGAAAAKIIAEETEKMGDVALTAEQKIAAQRAELENLQREMGEQLLPTYLAVNEAMIDQVRLLTDSTVPAWERFLAVFNPAQAAFLRNTRAAREYAEANKDAAESNTSAAESAEPLNEELNLTFDTINGLKGAIKFYTERLNDLQIGSDAYRVTAEQLKGVQEALNDALRDGDEAGETFEQRLARLLKKARELNEEFRAEQLEAEEDALIDFAALDEQAEQNRVNTKLTGIEEQIKIEEDKAKREEEIWLEQQQKEAQLIDENTDLLRINTEERLAMLTDFANQVGALDAAISQRRIDNLNTELQAEQDRNAAFEEEQRALLEAEQITEQQFNARINNRMAKERQLTEQIRNEKRRQARNEKDIATLEAIVNTAAQITKVAANPALVAFVSTLGALQVATIRATPIPQFAEGVIGFNGVGTETSDSNLAWLSKNESVIKAAGTHKYRDELEAANNMNLEQLIHAKYVKPALEKQKTYDDFELRKLTKRNKSVNIENADVLASMIAKASKRDFSHRRRI